MLYTRGDIKEMLESEDNVKENLFALAHKVKADNVGDGVYLRGLIEYSNVCRKDCLYCGIRSSAKCERYTLSTEQVLEAARYAYDNNYGSVVLQGGENTSYNYIDDITHLLQEIKRLSNGRLGVTLSLGEQSLDTYQRWFEAGAHRYLLRIESSKRALYEKIHPFDSNHTYDTRIQALNDLRTAGYQVGTGVMIGLPFQTIDDLADDLMFMNEMDIDMCGMGPYILSKDTPLEKYANLLQSESWRFEMTLKMIAVLRIIMPTINIAATTALQAIDPMGRLKAINVGANVVMPNITPDYLRSNYSLYNNKPLSLDSKLFEDNIKYGEWGDSRHFKKRNER